MIILTYSYHYTLFRITFPTFVHATEPLAVDRPPPGESQEHCDWLLAVFNALVATNMRGKDEFSSVKWAKNI